jgi:uncharacterized protein (DUF362 family)/NAD-dependent dihydropyrimidine dehydrogenase PreA subunit
VSTVGFERCRGYDLESLGRAIRKALEPLGGISSFVRKGDRVLIKPNVVAPAHPDSGVCTHPNFVRAVCDIVAGEAPARIRVGDVPGYNYQGEARRCLNESGLVEALAGGPAELVFFERDFVRTAGAAFRTYRHIDLAREVEEADVVISLPKPKTHRLTLFTGAIKNVFGCVSFGTRMRIHKLGDFRAFCDGLVDIYDRVRPALSIADLIRVRQGNGPCGGTPLDAGAVLASADGVALDAVGQYLLGFGSGEVLTTALACERGLGEGHLDRIHVAGPNDWKGARVMARRPDRFFSWAHFRLPKALFKPIAAAAKVEPVFASRDCNLCGLCVKTCPGRALSLGKRTVRRDRKACRLCFNCVASCPRGAAASRLDAVSEGIKRMTEKSLR